MIFANGTIKSEEIKMEFGTLHQMIAGEKGRGRRLLAITCQHPGMSLHENVLHKDMTIGATRSGKPKLVTCTDNRLYMLLSSAGGYTRRGDGVIRVMKAHADDFRVIARGNGADGDAGRIGRWDVVLIEVLHPDTDFVVCVRTSGGGYGTPSDLYVGHNGKIYHSTADRVHELYDELDIEMPFVYETKGFDLREWVII